LTIAHPPEAQRGDWQFTCTIATCAMHTKPGKKFPIWTEGYIQCCVWIIGKRCKHFSIWRMRQLDVAIAQTGSEHRVNRAKGQSTEARVGGWQRGDCLAIGYAPERDRMIVARCH